MKAFARAMALAACTTTPAIAADTTVRIDNAWVRPANVGQAAVPLYADVTSDKPLKLVGAESDIAKSAALLVPELVGEQIFGKPVPALDLAPGSKLRLAFRGPFVELRDITRLVRTGDSVPFTLVFADDADTKIRVSAQAVVRGITPRSSDFHDGPSGLPSPPPAGAKATPGK